MTEIYLWWMRQYSSYKTIGSLFDVAYTRVGPILDEARQDIVQVYPTVTGFSHDHDVTPKNFVEKYGTNVSKCTGDDYYGCKIVLGCLYGGYHKAQSMGGIAG